MPGSSQGIRRRVRRFSQSSPDWYVTLVPSSRPTTTDRVRVRSIRRSYLISPTAHRRVSERRGRYRGRWTADPQASFRRVEWAGSGGGALSLLHDNDRVMKDARGQISQIHVVVQRCAPYLDSAADRDRDHVHVQYRAVAAVLRQARKRAALGVHIELPPRALETRADQGTRRSPWRQRRDRRSTARSACGASDARRTRSVDGVSLRERLPSDVRAKASGCASGWTSAVAEGTGPRQHGACCAVRVEAAGSSAGRASLPRGSRAWPGV